MLKNDSCVSGLPSVLESLVLKNESYVSGLPSILETLSAGKRQLCLWASLFVGNLECCKMIAMLVGFPLCWKPGVL